MSIEQPFPKPQPVRVPPIGPEVEDWVEAEGAGDPGYGEGDYGAGPYGEGDGGGDYLAYRQQNESANAELARRQAAGIDITDPFLGGTVVPSGDVDPYEVLWVPVPDGTSTYFRVSPPSTGGGTQGPPGPPGPTGPPGPPGPAGGVVVSATEPEDPEIGTIWVQP